MNDLEMIRRVMAMMSFVKEASELYPILAKGRMSLLVSSAFIDKRAKISDNPICQAVHKMTVDRTVQMGREFMGAPFEEFKKRMAALQKIRNEFDEAISSLGESDKESALPMLEMMDKVLMLLEEEGLSISELALASIEQ